MPQDGKPNFYAKTLEEWRDWLEEHCETEKRIWLIVYQKGTDTPSVRFLDAIEHALCYGWVDSKAIKRDDESCYLCFTPRSPKSTWGRWNRKRAEQLIEEGWMRPRGQAVIDHAKKTGTWDALADAQNCVVPPDLRDRFAKNARAKKNFDAFPPSSRRLILQWIETAKKPETRARRIAETVRCAAKNMRANHPKPAGAKSS